jgi:23S rRNA (uracil1939-C5)-methyltransferase/tRNA (uracil-5-)-methyltransferase
LGIFLITIDVEFKQPKKFVAVPFGYHEQVELTICDITNLGLAVGRVKDWVVMVLFVCVGETVIISIHKKIEK